MAGNVGSGMMSDMVVNGSLSKTAVNGSADAAVVEPADSNALRGNYDLSMLRPYRSWA
ncbi:MAG: hypothetical protein ABW122_05570 [Ilumatobacteraceae bacterium]